MVKIISLKQLVKTLNTKYCSLNTVLATGCFDILHQGHKNFLKAAKNQGDVLIIGIESDKRVRKLKGETRPINDWQKRAKTLVQIDIVDFVFLLPESFGGAQDRWELLQLIKPNILAVSENTPYLEKKKKLIEKIGGRIFVYPFNPRYSTSKLLHLNS